MELFNCNDFIIHCVDSVPVDVMAQKVYFTFGWTHSPTVGDEGASDGADGDWQESGGKGSGSDAISSSFLHLFKVFCCLDSRKAFHLL